MQIQTLEELSLNALCPLQLILDDGWILRFANGFTKRANSITPLYPGMKEESLIEKIDRSRRIYQSFNLPTIFRLTDTPPMVGIRSYLRRSGVRKAGLCKCSS